MKKLLVGTALALTVLGTAAVSAQEGEMPPLPEGATVVAEGLTYPRQLWVAEDGIYVAEAGPGDPTVPPPDPAAEPEEGAMPSTGFTARVVWVGADGAVTPVVQNLPSVAGESGASAVTVAGDQLWVITAGPGPFGDPLILAGAALVFDAETYRLEDYIDIYTYEAEVNPDGNEVDNNPVDMLVASDGTVYIVDAGGNAVLTWSEEAGLETFITWPENPVPTGIAEGSDGNLYVSFLGAELAPGAGMVQVISPAGEVLETWSGYNTLTDVTVADDGSVYVVSLTAGFGEQGPMPGQILRANADGGEVVVDGLLFPYGVAIGNDGNLLVSTGTTFVPPGAGMVLSIPTGM